MPNRENEIFIGSEFLNVQGREIKHPALIKYYANLNMGKISNEMLKFLGLDIETDSNTAELKLLGFWNGNKYTYYIEDFMDILFQFIKYSADNNWCIAYWNRLDPTIIYKQFLLLLDNEDEKIKSLERFSKITGEWDKKAKIWKIPPVVEIEIGDYKVGIITAVRSSIKFFYYNKYRKNLKTCWAYDIAGLYENGLEKEASKRLSYYSKVDESAHLVDWEKFKIDDNYRNNIVLKSNELDARAVYDLAVQLNEEFKRTFGYYPTNLVSQGSFARSALVATITNKYKDEKDENKRKKLILNDLKSININTHIDQWIKKYDPNVIKDMYECIVEAYSAGYIETIRYGYTPIAYYADIASAYPGTIKDLLDLTNSKITFGEGTPPKIKNSYCFVRGLVDIPDHLDFIPLTIKHPVYHETNIRATGKYYASYTLDEREFLEEFGAIFMEEKWFNIETLGKLSPIAHVSIQFAELRANLIKAKDSAQYSAKIANSSLYGIEFEAVPYYEMIDNEIVKIGYRAGEFFNPLYACIITARTRIKLARACKEIEMRGGKVILLMTDSVFWSGKANMLPSELWKEEKTLGYFEKPQEVYELTCLGSGRYGYSAIGKDGKEYYTAKKRGLNAVDIHDPSGSVLDDFDWYKCLKMAYDNNLTKVKVNVRLLVTVGIVLHNSKYDIKDLGLVTTEEREVELIVGGTKRLIPHKCENPAVLINNLVKTRSIYIDKGADGNNGYYDGTLPILRKECEKYQFKTDIEKDRARSRKTSNNFYDKHKNEINNASKELYKMLKESGFSPLEAKKYSRRSTENVKELINSIM